MKRTIRRRPRRSAFTLFEVLLVLVILVILTSTVGVSLVNAQRRAYLRQAKNQINVLKGPLTDYHIDVGTYPSTDLGLAALRTAPENQAKWDGPYLEKDLPMDPWGNPYQYQLVGSEYRIWSFGPDGQDGSGDEVSND